MESRSPHDRNTPRCEIFLRKKSRGTWGYTDLEIPAWCLNYETMLRYSGEKVSGFEAGSVSLSDLLFCQLNCLIFLRVISIPIFQIS